MYAPKYIRRAHCTDMNRLNNPPLFGKRPAMCGDDSAAYIMDQAMWVTALPNEPNTPLSLIHISEPTRPY